MDVNPLSPASRAASANDSPADEQSRFTSDTCRSDGAGNTPRSRSLAIHAVACSERARDSVVDASFLPGEGRDWACLSSRQAAAGVLPAPLSNVGSAPSVL